MIAQTVLVADDDEKIREDLEQEEWLSKLESRKEKKNDTGRKN